MAYQTSFLKGAPAFASAGGALQSLVQVVLSMGETTDLDTVLDTIEQETQRIFACRESAIVLYDESAHEFVCRGPEPRRRFSADHGVSGEALRTRCIRFVDSHAVPNRAPGGLLTVPLMSSGGRFLGVLHVFFEAGAARLNDRLHSVAGAFGTLGAISIQRQRLEEDARQRAVLQRELQLARDVIRAVLPDSPLRLGDLEIAGRLRPAGQVGGDLYDFVSVDDHRLSFFLADAVGHGLGPTLMVTQCRAFYVALRSNPYLDQVASEVNQLIIDCLRDHQFVTACFGSVEARSGRVDLVSAGQGPILWYRAGLDIVDSIVPGSIPLGILPNQHPEVDRQVRLSAGDRLLIVSDGVTEWENEAGEPYGEARLIAWLRSCGEGNSEELVKDLITSVTEFAGGNCPKDDVTALLLRRI